MLIRFAGDLSSGAIAGICVGVVVFIVVLTVVIYLIVRSQNKTTSSRVHVRTKRILKFNENGCRVTLVTVAQSELMDVGTTFDRTCM